MKRALLIALLIYGSALAQVPKNLKAVKGTFWGYVLQKDEMTGDNTSWAGTNNDDERSALLVIACGGGNPDVLFYAASTMSGDPQDMYYKFDNGKVVGPFKSVVMKFGGDRMAALPKNVRSAFLDSMKTGKMVMMRTYNDDGEQKTYSFHVPGAISALKGMSSCK